MTWRLVEHQWPNGRPYWTIENPETREVRVGRNGQVSKYWDHAIAFTERNRLNDEAAAKPSRLPALKPEDDDFDLIEET